jgi:hypothetical protein
MEYLAFFFIKWAFLQGVQCRPVRETSRWLQTSTRYPHNTWHKVQINFPCVYKRKKVHGDMEIKLHALSCDHTERYVRHARYVRYVCYTNRKNIFFYWQCDWPHRALRTELCVASHIVNKWKYFSVRIANIAYVALCVATSLQNSVVDVWKLAASSSDRFTP